MEAHNARGRSKKGTAQGSAPRGRLRRVAAAATQLRHPAWAGLAMMVAGFATGIVGLAAEAFQQNPPPSPAFAIAATGAGFAGVGINVVSRIPATPAARAWVRRVLAGCGTGALAAAFGWEAAGYNSVGVPALVLPGMFAMIAAMLSGTLRDYPRQRPRASGMSR